MTWASITYYMVHDKPNKCSKGLMKCSNSHLQQQFQIATWQDWFSYFLVLSCLLGALISWHNVRFFGSTTSQSEFESYARSWRSLVDGDEGCICPSGKLYSLWHNQKNMQNMHDNIPYLLDFWADLFVHLLLVKIFMARDII